MIFLVSLHVVKDFIFIYIYFFGGEGCAGG